MLAGRSGLRTAGERDAAAGRRRGRLRRAVNDLTDLLDATRQIAAQTRQRLAGTTPDRATRRVSLHDRVQSIAAAPATTYGSTVLCRHAAWGQR